MDMEQHSNESSLNLNNYDAIFRSTSSSKNCSSEVEWLKRMVKLIVFCLVLGFFFSAFSLFPHSFSVYFSTFLFSILTHAMERKYMFLICNVGILFLLATSSVSSSSSSFGNYCSFPHSYHNHHDNLFEHDVVAAVAIDEKSDSDHAQEEEEEEEEEEEKEEEICRGELLEEELDEDEGCFTDEVEEEEEEEEEDQKEGKRRELEIVVSTEELNKKIEDFIRKMKEEMRIQAAQTHLIAV